MKTERSRGIAMCAVMLVLQAFVLWAVLVASWCMKRNWTELLGPASLPTGTNVALKLGWTIPVVATVACVAVLTRLLMRRDIRVGDWLIAMAVGEIIAIALFLVGITEPALFITYRLAP